MAPHIPCSPPIYDNSAGALFNGLLAKLPAFFGSFSPVPQVITYCRVVGRGWWGATKWRGNTRCVVILVM